MKKLTVPLIIVVAIIFVLLIFGARLYQIVPPGYVTRRRSF